MWVKSLSTIAYSCVTLTKFRASLSFSVFSSNMEKTEGLIEKTQAAGSVSDCSLSFSSILNPPLTHPPSWLPLILWMLLAVTLYVLGSMLEVLRLRLYLDALALLFFLYHCVAMVMVGGKGERQPERKDGAQPWRSVDLAGDCAWWAGALWGPLSVHSISRHRQEIGGGTA